MHLTIAHTMELAIYIGFLHRISTALYIVTIIASSNEILSTVDNI